MTQEIVRALVNGVWVTEVANQGGGGSGGITEITSQDNSVTITDPTGPTADLSVSGGSQPNLIRVEFAFDTPNINVGVDVHAFAAGDYLLAVWIEVLTAWDGTTPKADVGVPSLSQFGLYSQANTVVDLTIPWGPTLSSTDLLTPGDSSAVLVPAAPPTGSNFQVPLRFVAPHTLKVWASRDGASGGTATGGAAGSGAVVLQVGATA